MKGAALQSKNGRQLINFLSDQEIQIKEAKPTILGPDPMIYNRKDPFENKLGRLKPGEFSCREGIYKKAHFDFAGSTR